MGKRRIEIKKIEDKKKQQVTFTKRRKRLLKMAMELGQKYDAEVAVTIRSNASNIFAFGHPSNLPEDDLDETEESPDDDDDDQEMSDCVMEVNKAKLSSENRNGDQDEVHDVAEKDDISDIEEFLDDDDDDVDQEMSDHEMEKTVLMMMTVKMMIRRIRWGSQKNATDQQVQDTGNVVKKQENSTANSIMMPNLIRDVPPVDDLELHELQESMAQLEKMKKKVTDPVNQIRKSSADSSCDFNKNART
nr:MADS-box transcription factor 23-like [Coffea arabica]